MNQMKAFSVTSVAQFLLALTAFTSLTAGFLSLFLNRRPLSQFLSSVKPLQWNFPSHSLWREFLCIWAERFKDLFFYKAALSPQTQSKADLKTADSCIVCKVFPWMLKSSKNELNALYFVLWITFFSVIILYSLSYFGFSFCLFFYSIPFTNAR